MTSIAADTVVELIGIRTWLEVLCIREVTPLHDEASLAVVRERLADADVHVAADALAFARANRAPARSNRRAGIAHTRLHDPRPLGPLLASQRGSSLYSLVHDVRRQAQREHRAIVRALDDLDPEAAATAMLGHRESTLATWIIIGTWGLIAITYRGERSSSRAAVQSRPLAPPIGPCDIR